MINTRAQTIARPKVHFLAAAAFAAAAGGGLAAVLWNDAEMVAALAAGGCAVLIAFLYRPQIWIYTVVLSLYYFFHTTQEDAGASGLGWQEIAFGLFYHTTLFVWFAWQIFVRRTKLVRTGADRMFLLFMALLPLNFIAAYFNDVEPFVWVRGWQYYLLLLYYFPIREYFSDERDLRRLLGVWGILLCYTGVMQVIKYKAMMANFKWANQIYYMGVRRAGYFFSVLAIITLAGMLLDSGRLRKLVWTAAFLLSAAVLTVSLARTAWVGFLAGVIAMGIALPFRHRVRLAAYSFGAVAVISVAALIFFPRIAGMAATVIQLRFASSANVGNDPSYLSRAQENEQLIAGTLDYPLGGQGLQKEHLRYDMIDLRHVVSSYGHNGYLTFSFLLGIPLAALFYSVVAYYTLAALWRARGAADGTARLLFAAVGGASVTSLVVNINGVVYNQRDGLFVTAFLWGLFGIAGGLEARRRAAARRQPDADG